jgi:AraC-like DNA-binding protein
VVGINRRLRYTAVYPSAALLHEAGFPKGADLGPAVVDDRALRMMFARALAPDTPGEDAEEALLIALAGLAGRYGTAPGRLPPTTSRAVTQATDYIQAELSAELRLESIANRAGVGPRHLIRCFRQVLGMTPQEYVRQARVSAAAAQLRRGEAPARAAHGVGFADQPHMTRAFRSVMGITPAAYARSWRG